MPYHSPYQWYQERPQTSNAIYGWYMKDYEPLPRDDMTKPYTIVQKPKPDLTYVGVKVPRQTCTSRCARLPPVSQSMPGAMRRSNTWGPGNWASQGQKGGFVPFEKQYEERLKQDIQKSKTDTLRQLEKATGEKQLIEPPNSFDYRALITPRPPPAPTKVSFPKKLTSNYLWHVNAGYLVHVKP